MCTLRFTEGVLSGCTKAGPLEPDGMCYRKQKLTELSQKSFTFYTTCFILRFLSRMFPKTVGVPQHLLTVHPKLIFRGTLKKAPVVTEGRSYQTQYFAKIFPSPLASSLQIHFYLHFQESSWNALC